MQELQMTIWETLQVPTVDRIALMSKYSTEMFAQVFDDSVALWTDVAVMVAARMELKKMFLAMQVTQKLSPGDCCKTDVLLCCSVLYPREDCFQSSQTEKIFSSVWYLKRCPLD
jgi:hypothetical protein